MIQRAKRIAIRGWQRAISIATFGYFPYIDNSAGPVDWCVADNKSTFWQIKATSLFQWAAGDSPTSRWIAGDTSVGKWSTRESISYTWSTYDRTVECD